MTDERQIKAQALLEDAFGMDPAAASLMAAVMVDAIRDDDTHKVRALVQDGMVMVFDDHEDLVSAVGEDEAPLFKRYALVPLPEPTAG